MSQPWLKQEEDPQVALQVALHEYLEVVFSGTQACLYFVVAYLIQYSFFLIGFVGS
jgi:hypothetical protein